MSNAGRSRAVFRTRSARGFTLMELMIVMALIAILLSVAFARYRNAETLGNEAAAMASLRTIAKAQWEFAQTCGNQRYATSLTALGQPVPSTGQAFLSPDLTTADKVEKSGYRIQITAAPLEDTPPACNGAPAAAGFAATADPLRPGQSGTRFFGINASRVLYADKTTFTGNMPESGAPGHGQEQD